MNLQRSTAKWGFGMAPISSRMRRRYDAAVQSALDFLYDNTVPESVLLDDVSELKGMFNRCIRQDQWDWFSVLEEFGNPAREDMVRIADGLLLLRRSLATKDDRGMQSPKRQLVSSNLCLYLNNYQGALNLFDKSSDSGWIYILSRREQDTILKIGMTRRSVGERVAEINSATGVLFPLSARRVFRAKYAENTEREIHRMLAQHRIRPDREFFEMQFSEAVGAIEEYLEKSRRHWRQRGEVAWFDPKLRYGFIAGPLHEDAFVHFSEVRKDDLVLLQPGAAVEYDLWHSPRGPYACRILILASGD